MPNKVVGVLVLYRPDNDIVDITKTNRKILDDIVVICNGEVPNGIIEILKSVSINNIIYNTENVGLAKATNQGIEVALGDLNAEFVVLLDQDSVLPKNYLSLIAFYNANKINVGIVSPFYFNALVDKTSLNIVFRFLSFKKFGIKKNCIQNDMPIASGSLIHKSIFEKFGLMKESYFIDYVDNEFAMRLRVGGYVNFTFPQVIMDHRLGNPTVNRILGFKIVSSNHSPLRKYYITRNRLDYIKLYYKFKPSIIFYEILSVVYDLVKIIAFEQEKVAKLKYMLYGVNDFLIGKFGKSRLNS